MEGVLRLSRSVFLGPCACGLRGLSHPEEPWGDIFGHGLSGVQAHTESLTDAGTEERGMFSYGRKPGLIMEGRERKREGNQEKRQMSVFDCGRDVVGVKAMRGEDFVYFHARLPLLKCLCSSSI